MTRVFHTILLVACSVVASCGVVDPGDEDRDALDEAKRRWAAQGYDSYEYRLTRVCFCPVEYTRPYVIRVNNGVVVDVRDAATGGPPPDQYQARTIPQLFDVISDAIDRDAHSLVTEYHAQLGYPERISIDYDVQTADEEVTFRTEALQPLR